MTPPDPLPIDAFDRPLAARPTGVIPSLRKYSKIFRASLVERMTYRLDFILGTLLRFLPILTTILLSGRRSSEGRNRIRGIRGGP